MNVSTADEWDAASLARASHKDKIRSRIIISSSVAVAAIAAITIFTFAMV